MCYELRHVSTRMSYDFSKLSMSVNHGCCVLARVCFRWGKRVPDVVVANAHKPACGSGARDEPTAREALV